MISKRRVFNHHHRQSGMTLVELMIALALGLFLVGGVLYVFLGSKINYNVNEHLSRMQENGRFGMAMLTRDLRQSGFLGCAQNVDRIKNTLNDTASDYLWRFDEAVNGFEATPSGWTPSLDSTIPAPKSGTDVVTLRRTNVDGLDVTQHNTPSADIKVLNNDILEVGDIAMVTDCKDAAIFQITNINSTGGGFNLVHNTGTGTPGNFTSDLGKDFENNGKVFRMETATYYVADPGNGVGSLWRKINDEDAEELIPGVEDLQLLYGEDTNDDRRADQYVTADAVNLDNVVSIRTALLVTSLDEPSTESVPYDFVHFSDANPGDNRLRREFTTTVNLRNRTP